MTSDHTMTTDAGDLAAALRATHRFTAPPSEYLPPLECVRLRAGDGHFTIDATNRYVAGHARLMATGTLPTVLIHRDLIKLVLAFLASASTQTDLPLPVHVYHNRTVLQDSGGTLEITCRDLLLRIPCTPTGGFPPVEKIYKQADELTPGLEAPVSLDLRWPGLFAKVAKDFKGQVQWHFFGPRKPIRIQIGDTFTGIIMPIRLESPVPLLKVGGGQS